MASIEQDYRQIILDARKSQLRLTVENVRRLEGVFDAAIQSILAKIEALPVERQGTAWHRAQFGLLNDIRATMEGLKKDYQTLLEAGMVEIAQNAADREAATAQLVNAATDASLFPDLSRTLTLSTGASVQVQFGRLALQAVDRATTRYYSDGLKLSDRLYNLNSLTKRTIEDTITQGLVEGTSARDLAKQMQETLMSAGSDNPRYHAMRIARSEISHAHREAHVLSTQTSPGVLKDYISGIRWNLSLAHKNRDICDMYADYDTGLGQGVYLPGDVPTDHPHGLCAREGHLVHVDGLIGSTTRRYTGKIVEIDCAGGYFLAVTPNHPVLTPEGWIAAGKLHEGSYVVCTPNAQGVFVTIDPDYKQVPSLIEDIASTLRKPFSVSPRSVPTTAKDFHGDGIDGQVCIIRSDSFLRNTINTTLIQPFSQEQFGRCCAKLLPFTGQSQGAFMREGFNSSSPHLQSDASARAGFIGHGRLADLDTISFRSQFDTVAQEYGCDTQSGSREHSGKMLQGFTGNIFRDNIRFHSAKGDRAAKELIARNLLVGFGKRNLESIVSDAQVTSQTLDRLSGEVCFNRVSKVRQVDFSGQVYNLHTDKEYYIVNDIVPCRDYANQRGGIIVHNCFTTTALLNYPMSGVGGGKPDVSAVPDNQRRKFEAEYPQSVQAA